LESWPLPDFFYVADEPARVTQACDTCARPVTLTVIPDHLRGALHGWQCPWAGCEARNYYLRPALRIINVEALPAIAP